MRIIFYSAGRSDEDEAAPDVNAAICARLTEFREAFQGHTDLFAEIRAHGEVPEWLKEQAILSGELLLKKYECAVADAVALLGSRSDNVGVTARAAALSNAARGGPMPSEIVWMPVGEHEISAGISGGGEYAGRVICDEEAFNAIQASFEELQASGQRVWLDVDHDDGAAAADVRGFSWDPTRGIIAHVEWTDLGTFSVTSRRFISFSPAFAVSRNTGKVHGLLTGLAAGGLVNAPAFGEAMPFLTT